MDTANKIAVSNIQSSGNQRYIVSSASYNDGKWHHITIIIVGGSNIMMYVGGISQGSSTLVGTVTQLNYGIGNTIIGRQSKYVTPERFFNGSIDEVRILNRAVYQAKITTGYFRRKQHTGA